MHAVAKALPSELAYLHAHPQVGAMYADLGYTAPWMQEAWAA